MTRRPRQAIVVRPLTGAAPAVLGVIAALTLRRTYGALAHLRTDLSLRGATTADTKRLSQQAPPAGFPGDGGSRAGSAAWLFWQRGRGLVPSGGVAAVGHVVPRAGMILKST